MFLAHDATALQALVGPSIFVIRSASGGNTSKRMTGIIELLAATTREYYRTINSVLYSMLANATLLRKWHDACRIIAYGLY